MSYGAVNSDPTATLRRRGAAGAPLGAATHGGAPGVHNGPPVTASGAPSAIAAAAVAASRRRGTAPLPVTLLLRFQDPEVETAYQAYARASARAADGASLALSFAAVVAALLHALTSVAWRASASAGGGAAPHGCRPAVAVVAAAIPALLSLALLALFCLAPRTYERWRGPALAAGRIYRAAAWAALLQPRLVPQPPAHSALRSFLLTPAASNLLFVVFHPLPLEQQLWLMAATTAASAARGAALGGAGLLAAPQLRAHIEAAAERVSRMARYLDLPAHRLAPRAGVRALSPADVAWCLHAFCCIVLGGIVPLLALLLREVHVRVSFLSRLAPAVAPRQVAATRHGLYSATLSSCFLLLSLVPSVWGVLQLVPRHVVGADGGVRGDGLALVATVLGVEAYMRVWLLAVFNLLSHGARYGLTWCATRLLTAAGHTTRLPGSAGGADPAPQPPTAATGGTG